MKSSPCEARSAYLGFVAHEFRNPLATALWCAQLLGRLAPEERAGARGLKLAATAQRAMTRVARLLEDHFLIERLEAGGLPLRPERVDLAAALRDAAEAAGVGGATSISISRPVTVEVDRAILGRCLEAVVAAAGKEGAHLEVQVEEPAGAVRVRFSGAPLDPAALERPVKGSPSDVTGRAMGLFAARTAAAALGAALALDGGALCLSFPGAGP